MPKLIISVGVSGSGKSTWARTQNAVTVSRDNIRMALFGTEDFIDEELVTKVEHGMIRDALVAGHDVISDNTNIQPKYRNAMARIAYDVGASAELKFFDTSLEDCLKNNKSRAEAGGRNVPEDVIRKQHQRMQGNKDKALPDPFTPRRYSGTPGKMPAVLVDVDGTLAINNGHRSFYDWSLVGGDDPYVNVIRLVQALHEQGYDIIVMSGRDSVCRDETQAWLQEHEIPYRRIYMRPEGDQRSDNIVKHELFWEYVAEWFDVKFVLDDRDQVVKLWRDMGLDCFQVGYGNF